VPNKGSGSESFFGLLNPGLWTLIRQGKYDAVLCYTGYRRASFWITYFAAKLSRTKFLFGTDATTIFPRDGRLWKARVKKILWPRLFRIADQVIVPSTPARDLMLSLKLAAARVSVISCAVDNDWWMKQSAAVDRDAVRAQWDVLPDDPVVLFCGKLQPWKRPLDLLQAFAQAALPNGLLVIAGDGPLRSQLQAEALALGIAARVRFLGFVNQSHLPAIYTGADVMVLPSEYEAFAVVVNEAMCCGCPVIASDCVGASRDLIVPVSPGLVYPRGDVAALTATLRKIFEEGGNRNSLGAAARTHMKSWSPAQNVIATVEAVRSSMRS
jgi:glycosyltransferase involved in cell wall biosynthesis